MTFVSTIIDQTLDQAEACLRSMKVEAGMSLLLENLQSVKRSATSDLWKTVRERCLNHPVRDLVHQDPLTARAFKKNRIHNYACDPALLDFLYGHESVQKELAEASELGRRINAFLCQSPTGQSLRWRQRYLAQQLDLTAALCGRARVLSVASGRLRETMLSKAIKNGGIERFVAFDQDPETLDLIARELRSTALELKCGKLKALLREPIGGEFDLIYSAGLYDYLPDAIAVSLTNNLVQQLSPGGRLLIAIFVPDNYEGGYMDCFMQWNLLYRDVASFKKFMEQACPEASLTVFRDETNHAAWFEIQREPSRRAVSARPPRENSRLLQALL